MRLLREKVQNVQLRLVLHLVGLHSRVFLCTDAFTCAVCLFMGVDLGSRSLQQVLWEMITREIPFKGLEGLQVAWLVVEKNEVVECQKHVYQTAITPSWFCLFK